MVRDPCSPTADDHAPLNCSFMVLDSSPSLISNSCEYTLSHTPILLYSHTSILSYLILSYSHTVIQPYSHTSYSHTVIQPYSHTVIQPYSHTSYSHTLIQSYSHTLIPHTLILSYSHTAILSYLCSHHVSYESAQTLSSTATAAQEEGMAPQNALMRQFTSHCIAGDQTITISMIT